MELKEFIKEVLADITNAISESQSELNNGSIISPSLPNAISTKTIEDSKNNRLISQIDFEVALVTENKQNNSKEIGGNIKVLSAGLNGDKSNRIENVSHIRFSIPIVLPFYSVKSSYEKPRPAYKAVSESSCTKPDSHSL